jgi:hypothetical protein
MTVPVGGGSVSTKKQNPSDGKRHVSMMETGTETPFLPVPETITTSPVMETITTSRSRVPSSLATSTAAVSAIRSCAFQSLATCRRYRRFARMRAVGSAASICAFSFTANSIDISACTRLPSASVMITHMSPLFVAVAVTSLNMIVLRRAPAFSAR